MQIDNGSVHNEYYFDWISSANNDNMDIEEIACGDIETIYRIIMNKNKIEIKRQIAQLDGVDE
jgi:hypothetical protein